VDLNGNWNLGGVRTNTYVGTWAWAQFLSYWSVNAQMGFNPPALSDNLTRGGPLGYSSMGGNVWLTHSVPPRSKVLISDPQLIVDTLPGEAEAGVRAAAIPN